MILDSGDRRLFDSGAVRDVNEEKGRCDLLPLGVAGEFLYEDRVLKELGYYVETGVIQFLFSSLDAFCIARGWDKQTLLLEVAIHYAEGAKKYAERNWEKGIPVHCYIDSAVRHYIKFSRGDKDEFHDRAFAWNILGAIWTIKHHPELKDIG